MPAFPISIPESEENKIRELARTISGRKSAILVVGEKSLEVPEAVCRLLANILEITEEATSVAVIPQLEELSTQQAAELLRVSRQYLVRLLDNGKIPFHKVGTHRRVFSKDLVEYKRWRDQPQRHVPGESPQFSFHWE